RILAHEHRVERGELRLDRILRAIPLVIIGADFEAAHGGGDRTIAQEHLARLERVHLVPAARGLAHHRDGGILVRLQVVERVDDEGEPHAFAALTSRAEARPTSSSTSYAAASIARRATTP